MSALTLFCEGDAQDKQLLVNHMGGWPQEVAHQKWLIHHRFARRLQFVVVHTAEVR